MKRCMSRGLVLLAFLFLFLPRTAAYASRGEVITVAAASSFSYALGEIKKGFEERGGARVRLVFGSSGLLARQIERGAPFDVFISANSAFMDGLVRAGAVRAGSVKRFARGVLVLASRAGDGRAVEGIEGLLDRRIRRVAIANPAHAPYGRAAMEALKGAGILEKIRKKLVYGENVRQALQFIESGNAEAGFMALSIAGRRGIRYVPLDPALYRPIEQTAATVKGTSHAGAAGAFVGYLTGPEGREILQRYGFRAP